MQIMYGNMIKVVQELKQNPLFVYSSEAIVLINHQFIIGDFNLAAKKQYKLEESHKFTHISQFLDLTKNNSLVVENLNTKGSYNKLFWLELKNGSSFLADVKVVRYDEEHYLLFIHDLSTQYGDSLINKLAEKFISHSVEGILVTDKNNKIILVNKAFEQVTGYTKDEVSDHDPSILKSGIHDHEFYNKMWNSIQKEGSWSGEIWNRKKNGEVYAERLTICAIYNSFNEVTNYIALFIDISNQKLVEEQLVFLAHHDSLTGVDNRYSLNIKLNALLETAKLQSQQLAVLFLDLDRFKYVNDTLGHNFGDCLLKEVATRLKKLLHPKDIIARLGGDEFIIVVPNLSHAKEAIILAETIIASLSNSFFVNEIELVVTSSIGISIFPHDGDTMEKLLVHSDKAMYMAKANGRNNFEVYYKDLESNETEKMTKELYLRKALEKNELSLHLQPIFHSSTKKVACVESLIRWNNQKLGYIPANELIEIAEETGLIIPISEWIIKEACEILSIIHLNSYCDVKMAINISGIVFQQENFVRMVKDILQQTNVGPQYIIFELTESVIMTNKEETLNKLRQLKELGISISIDDFGTGYSSLSYLKRFPIDKLKIDQSFIRGLVDHHEDQNITKAIIHLGHSLDLKIIAEGVELEEQESFLTELHCDFLQGYYFSKPIPLQDLLEFLELWGIYLANKEI